MSPRVYAYAEAPVSAKIIPLRPRPLGSAAGANVVYARLDAAKYAAPRTVSVTVAPPVEARFEQLFAEYFEPLLRRAERVVGCGHRAKEVVLDVFTKFWHRRDEFDVHTSVEGYLKTAVTNRAIDYVRSAQRNRRFDGELPVRRPCPAAGPEEIAHGTHLAELIEEAIAALPPRGQEIFRLNRFEGLTYNQIAERCGVTYKTVETHMRRSLISLRNRLQPYVEQEL